MRRDRRDRLASRDSDARVLAIRVPADSDRLAQLLLRPSGRACKDSDDADQGLGDPDSDMDSYSET
jgi:hypothetical protein